MSNETSTSRGKLTGYGRPWIHELIARTLRLQEMFEFVSVPQATWPAEETIARSFHAAPPSPSVLKSACSVSHTFFF